MQKIFIATSLLFAACHNPNYCAGSPDNNCNETGDGGTTIDGNESISCVQTGCVNNSAGSVCDTDTKACVQCTDGPAGDHSACTLTTPVCSTTDTCRACAANSECASDACLPDGSCAAATDVAYVNATTGSGSLCTKAAPCTTITSAKSVKSIVRVTGMTSEQVAVHASLTIIGDHNAANQITSGITGNGGAMIAVDTLASLTMVDMALNGAGVAVSGLTNATAGTIELHHCSVVNSLQYGVYSTAGTVKLHRAMIATNKVAGVFLSTTSFVIDNSFIVHNGDNTQGAIGGLALSFSQGSLSYSTIARNLGSSGGAKGVICGTSANAFTSNILNGNSNGPYSGSCTWSYSAFDNLTTAPSGTSNTLSDPMFIDFDNDDFHLQTTSSLINAGDASTNLKVDFDAQQRPMGAGPDIGADEVQ